MEKYYDDSISVFEYFSRILLNIFFLWIMLTNSHKRVSSILENALLLLILKTIHSDIDPMEKYVHSMERNMGKQPLNSKIPLHTYMF
jgi:hypothetical protein